MHAQRASGLGARYHVRVRGQHQDAALGWVAVAGAHHEDLVLVPIPCGHAVDSNGPSGSGFDQGRNELERRFAVTQATPRHGCGGGTRRASSSATATTPHPTGGRYSSRSRVNH